MAIRRIITTLIVLTLGILGSAACYQGRTAAPVAEQHGEATPQIDCSGDWYKPTSKEVLDRCGWEKATRTARQEEEEQKTRQAQSYRQTIPGSKPPPPSPQLPQPEDTKLIEEIPLVSPNPEERQGLPVPYRNLTSWWRTGSVPNADYTEWGPLDVLSRPGNGAQYMVPGVEGLYTETRNPRLETLTLDHKYIHSWTCPRPAGELRITRIEPGTPPGIGADPPNFAGLNYKVYFTTKSGDMGHFDMATQTWTFDEGQQGNTTPDLPPSTGPTSISFQAFATNIAMTDAAEQRDQQRMLAVRQTVLAGTPVPKTLELFPPATIAARPTVAPLETGILERISLWGGAANIYGFRNHWAGSIGGNYIIVSAGSRADNPGVGVRDAGIREQGVVLVRVFAIDPDPRIRLGLYNDSLSGEYLTPTRSGPVRITSYEGTHLTLTSITDGTPFAFDVEARTWFTPSDIVLPTAIPRP